MLARFQEMAASNGRSKHPCMLVTTLSLALSVQPLIVKWYFQEATQPMWRARKTFRKPWLKVSLFRAVTDGCPLSDSTKLSSLVQTFKLVQYSTVWSMDSKTEVCALTYIRDLAKVTTSKAFIQMVSKHSKLQCQLARALSTGRWVQSKDRCISLVEQRKLLISLTDHLTKAVSRSGFSAWCLFSNLLTSIWAHSL